MYNRVLTIVITFAKMIAIVIVYHLSYQPSLKETIEMERITYDARLPQLRVTPQLKAALYQQARDLGIPLSELMRRKLSANLHKSEDFTTLEAISQ